MALRFKFFDETQVCDYSMKVIKQYSGYNDITGASNF